MASRTLRHRAKSAFLSATLATSVLVPLSASPALAVEQGRVSGRVTETAGPGAIGLGNICVQAFDQFDKPAGSMAKTVNDLEQNDEEAIGDYDITDLPAGVYFLRFRDCGNQRVPFTTVFGEPGLLAENDYATGWYSGGGDASGWYQSAGTVGVTVTGDNAGGQSGQNRTGIDAVLGQDSVISGTVTDDTDSSLLGGVCVQVLDAATGALVLETVSSDGSVTNRGAYSVRGLVEGVFKVHFRDDVGSCGAISRPAGAANHHEDPSAGGPAPTTLFSHDDEYWDNKQGLAQADPVQLPENGGTAGPIDAALARISQAQGFQGTVRDDSGNGAGGVCVSAYDSRDNAPVNTTTTNASGGYTLSLGVGGQYWVEVHERCVGPVDATHKDDVFVGEVHPNVHYADMHATTARVLTLTDIFGSGSVPADSARQTVSTNSFTSLNPQVAKRGSIAGTVTDSASPAAPLSGVCVVALEGAFAQSSPPPFAITDAQGAYTIPKVRPGSYVLRFLPLDGDQAANPSAGTCPGSQNQNGFLSEYYNDANARSSATLVQVANGAGVTGRDASLRPTTAASTISGRVTREGSTNGAVGICVRVLDLDGKQIAQTSSKPADATATPAVVAGDYTTPAVAPGQYQVQFLRAGAPGVSSGDAACPGTAPALTSVDYIITEWFNNQTRQAAAQTVTVGSTAVTGINNAVAPGARIVGTVSGNSGAAICVALLDAGQIVHRSVQTNGGDYALEGIAPGTWFIRFDDQDPSGTCGGEAFASTNDTYRTEFFSDKFTFNDATPVAVNANAERTAIDATMNAVQGPSGITGSLTGFVYDPDLDGSGSDQKRPLNGIIVEVFRFTQDPAVDQPVAKATTVSRDAFLRPFIDCPSSDFDNPQSPACETEPTEEGPATAQPIVAHAPPVAGYWRIDNIPLGSYKVRFRDPQGIHATEWYRDRKTFATAFSVVLESDKQVIKLGEEVFDADNYDRDQRATAPLFTGPGSGTDPDDPNLPADRKNATVAQLEGAGYTNCGTAPAPDFCTELRTVLSLAGNVAGRVTVEQGGVAAKDVRVDLLAEDTGNIAASAFTGADGRYQIPGVLPGGYKVKFTPADSNLKEEFFDNQMTFGAADVLAVGASTTRSNVNAALAQNTAPVAGDDTRQALVNATTRFDDLRSNDVDPEGDALEITSVGTPSHGTAVLNEDGSVSYTPETNNQDDATFTYTVADTQGLTDTATVTVKVVGQIVGKPPVAQDDEVSTAANTAVSINVLANDSDPDGTEPLQLTSVGVPFHGTASINGSSIVYTPENDFAGVDQFIYEVTDDQGFTANARVTVNVNASGVVSANKSVGANGTVATEGTTATVGNPIITTVTTPNAGTITIREEEVPAGMVSDISTVTWRSVITAPAATAARPLTITFRLDGSLLTGEQRARSIRVLRNNALVGDCLGSATANPDPCISGHRMVGDDVLITIKTSAASTWAFGFDNDAVVDRASGASGTGRVGTAVAVSRNAFSPAEVDTVVIARKDAYPDALAGAPLAFKLGAPMLLTTKDQLDTITRDEIVRLGASRVVILGGTAAVSSGVESALRAINGVNQVDRIRGADRFATAAAVAQQLGDYDLAYVVEGADANPSRGWPDAVAVASLAAFEGRPILLVTTEELPSATRNALQGLREAVIIGGTASVSTNVANAVDQVVGAVGRVRGTDRYETSFAVAQRAVAAGMSASSVWIATGQNFPDALAAGPAAAKEGGILLLVNGDNYDASPAVERFLTANRTKVETLTIVGGTAAVSVGSQIRMTQATTN